MFFSNRLSQLEGPYH